MKKNILALAGCLAATTPSISIADVLSENPFALNLGEISATSYLNQPFKGVIPFLFASLNNSRDLNVRLAPESIFNKIGVEKLPILNSLNFRITEQDNKPVILISSNQPIQQPFLNFVLEIQGKQGSIYQDYTVLLDPESNQVTTQLDDYIATNQSELNQSTLLEDYIAANQSKLDQSTSLEDYITTNQSELGQSIKPSADELLISRGTLLLANLSSRTLPKKPVLSNSKTLKYRVKTGDSLSRIAQIQYRNNASLSTMSRLIYQKNPTAFIKGDLNRIKKGALLSLPSESEINSFEIAKNITKDQLNPSNNSIINNVVKQQSEVSAETNISSKTALTENSSQKIYTVAKGDSLSKITRKFVSKDMSFTKMMNTIYINNPDAFVNRSKNKIKTGAKISIPVIAGLEIESKQISKAQQNTVGEIAIEKNSIPKVSDVEPNLDQYQVKEGDNLSIITKKVGYEGVPFAKMLKAIYMQNPDAFVDGNMAQILVGSVIKMPPLKSFTEVNKVGKSTLTLNKKLNQAVSSKALVSKTADSSNLIKRIRELRKELKQSKDNLSEMKEHLIDREIILQRKNIQLKAINASILKSNSNMTPELLAVSAVKKPISRLASIDNSVSEVELAELESDLLVKKDRLPEELTDLEKPENGIIELQTYKDSLDKLRNYETSSPVAVFINNNSSYLTLSLLLGLLLIRYRRELYYKYSAIRYDQPTYYPIGDSEKYELKERNINFHDPKMDEDSYIYDDLLPQTTKKVNDKSSNIVINPLLVEANEDIFGNDIELEKETKQIVNCDELITELLDDLKLDENDLDSTECKGIDKTSDNNIEKINEPEFSDVSLETKDGTLEDSISNLDNLITDLLNNFGKVDKNLKEHNIPNKSFPTLFKETET